MFCPKCGAPAASGAAFCARCGTPIAVVERQGHTTLAPPRTQSWLWLLILVAVLLLALVLFLLFRPSEETLALTVPQRKPAVLRQTAPAPVSMPQDVYDWLEHLRTIEEDKESLVADQKAKATVFMTKMSGLGALSGAIQPDGSVDVEDMKNPAEVAKSEIEDFKPPWDRLVAVFERVPPPEECRPIFSSYSEALREIAGQAGDITQTLRDLGTDPEAALSRLYKAQGSESTRIDDDLDEADRLVLLVCNKYKTDKWFKIKSDRASSAIMSQPGLGR